MRFTTRTEDWQRLFSKVKRVLPKGEECQVAFVADTLVEVSAETFVFPLEARVDEPGEFVCPAFGLSELHRLVTQHASVEVTFADDGHSLQVARSLFLPYLVKFGSGSRLRNMSQLLADPARQARPDDAAARFVCELRTLATAMAAAYDAVAPFGISPDDLFKLVVSRLPIKASNGLKELIRKNTLDNPWTRGVQV